jgi:hypothetical protein
LSEILGEWVSVGGGGQKETVKGGEYG